MTDQPLTESIAAGSVWPAGHRAALCISIDVDGRYGEEQSKTADPFWIHQTAYDATGTTRLLDLLADTQIAATFCWVGAVAEDRPDLVQRAVADGHEVAAHSWDHRRYSEMTHDEQRDDVLRTLDVLTPLAGERPVGHKSPGWRYDDHTFGVLQDLELVWAMDEPGGDLPYLLRPDPAKGPLVQLPPSWLYDDYPFFVDRLLTPGAAFEFWREDLDVIRGEGKLMCLTLHPFVSGRPGPSRALARLLDYAIDLGDIWIARADQIARWWLDRAGEAVPAR